MDVRFLHPVRTPSPTPRNRPPLARHRNSRAKLKNTPARFDHNLYQRAKHRTVILLTTTNNIIMKEREADSQIRNRQAINVPVTSQKLHQHNSQSPSNHQLDSQCVTHMDSQEFTPDPMLAHVRRMSRGPVVTRPSLFDPVNEVMYLSCQKQLSSLAVVVFFSSLTARV